MGKIVEILENGGQVGQDLERRSRISIAKRVVAETESTGKEADLIEEEAMRALNQERESMKNRKKKKNKRSILLRNKKKL